MLSDRWRIFDDALSARAYRACALTLSENFSWGGHVSTFLSFRPLYSQFFPTMAEEFNLQQARDLAESWNGKYYLYLCAIRSNEAFANSISHVFQKFKMAASDSVLSEKARAHAIPINNNLPHG